MLRRPFILSALAVTVLLALAASAAHSRPLRAAGDRGDFLTRSALDSAFSTVVIAAVVAGICLAPLMSFVRDPGTSRRLSPWRALRSIGTLVVVVLLIAFVFRHIHFGHHHVHTKHTPGTTSGGGGGSGTAFPWELVLGLFGLGVVALLLIVARRPRDVRRRARDRVETLEEAISESLDDLRTEPDLRRAIVAAYARMERALAATGVPRDPAEAPHEYLERALMSVDASAAAAGRLTELFERAKFSQHDPDSRMKDDAIDALVAVRDDLRARTAVAA